MIEGSDLTPAEFQAMNQHRGERLLGEAQQQAPREQLHPHHRLVRLTPTRLRALQVEDRIAREGKEMGRAGARPTAKP